MRLKNWTRECHDLAYLCISFSIFEEDRFFGLIKEKIKKEGRRIEDKNNPPDGPA